MGTHVKGIDDEILSNFVTEKFPLTPRWITEKFGLDKPSKETFLYADVAANGQVGNPNYPWEALDSMELFRNLVKKL